MITLMLLRRPVTIELPLILGHRHIATSELVSHLRSSPQYDYEVLSYTGQRQWIWRYSSLEAGRMSKDRDCAAP